jgi:hypothetical protein
MLAYVAILLQRLSLYNPGTGWAATDPRIHSQEYSVSIPCPTGRSNTGWVFDQ